MDKKTLIRNTKRVILGGAIGSLVASTLTSCFFGPPPNWKKVDEAWKKMNPKATSIGRNDDEWHPEWTAEQITDTLKIQATYNKYASRLKTYQTMLSDIVSSQAEFNQMLIKSAKAGNLDKIKEALQKGADVNTQDLKTGNTAAMIVKKKFPFAKSFLIISQLIKEDGFNRDIENNDGISIKDMVDAELSKGSAEWQSVSRKMDYAGQKRENTDIQVAISKAQKMYDGIMETFGNDIKNILGYKANIIEDNGYGYFDGKIVFENENNTKDTLNISFEPFGLFIEDHEPLVTITENSIRGENIFKQNWVSKLPRLGKLNIENLNPRNMDFKALAHDLVRGKENNKLNQIQKVYEESNQTNKGVSLAFYEQINTK